MAGKQNNINHIGLVLDASGSMQPYENTVWKVIDALMKQLAEQSQQLDQETRITVYSFNTSTTCGVYDKDVLRMPKGSDVYHCGTQATALIDAAMLAIAEMQETPQRYGDHAFLLYVLTDGQENASHRYGSTDLRNKIASLPSNWTLGALVPDFRSVAVAKNYGFPAGNVAVWNTTSASGVEEVGEVIKQSASTYMTQRSQGVQSTKGLFDTSHVTKAAVSASGMKPLDPSQYLIIPVARSAVDQQNADGKKVVEISRFVEKQGHTYVTGRAFYELKTRSRIQGNKAIAVVENGTGKVENSTGKVFTGPQARQLVGLPDHDVRIFPSHNKDYTIFVQSTSTNRHLVEGQKVLLLL
jgi:hypothetical protein